MRKMGPAFIGSIALHAGLLAMAFFSWQSLPDAVVVSSVPVELVSQIPEQEMASAPVDEQAVLAPVPEPMPEEPVVQPPEPDPIPDPKPAPKQPEVIKKDTKKPDPKKIEPVKKASPSKDGLKKPRPDTLDLDALSKTKSTPPKSNSRQAARPSVKPTDGISNQGASNKDAGEQAAMQVLGDRLSKLWTLNCDVPGSRNVNPEIRFTLSPNGRVVKAEWINRSSDPVWVAGANLALGAVNKGQPYADLPDGLYNRPLRFKFLAEEACRGQ